MPSQHAKVYRAILHELTTAVTPRKVNKTVSDNFRSVHALYEQSRDPRILQDLESALLFMRSQREHKILLERYNPTFDLTAKERIHATARRVGLDMPITHVPETN